MSITIAPAHASLPEHHAQAVHGESQTREISIEEREPEQEISEVSLVETPTVPEEVAPIDNVTHIPIVPFFSQFTDISAPEWKKVGCGIASLAMLIEYYEPGKVSVDTLLKEGINADAYLSSAGWTYAGLIGISKKYGLSGTTHDLGGMSIGGAFSELETALKEGPVMVSVHYTFDPQNPIPHLVIANGIDGDTLYYNDPAEKSGNGSVSVMQFKKAWKQRYIEIRPTV
jgi:predicted double-glycine peptidase